MNFVVHSKHMYFCQISDILWQYREAMSVVCARLASTNTAAQPTAPRIKHGLFRCT
jgi:hypothetical protein